MNLLTSCRTCLKQISNEFVPISPKIYDFLEEDLHLQRVPRVHSELELPQNVCFDCYRSIIALKTFLARCRDSEAFFINKLNGEMQHPQQGESTAVRSVNHNDEEAENAECCETILANDNEWVNQEDEEELVYLREEDEYDDNIIEAVQENTFFMEQEAIEPPVSVENNGNTDGESVIYEEFDHFSETESVINTNNSSIPDSVQETTEYLSETEEFNKKKRRRFQCQLCEKTFTSRYDLNMHENIHSGIKPFSCEVCGKSFRQKNVLRTHQALHFGKNVKCEECGKSFARKSQLIIHDRMHKNIKPFKCDYDGNCGAAFRERQHLVAHQKIHAGVRDHPCEFCPSAFFNRKSLLSHIRDVHSNVFYQCDRCSHRFNKPYKIRKHMDSAHQVQLTNVSQFKIILLESFNDEEVDCVSLTCDED